MQVNDAAFSACLSLLPESLRGAVQTASGTRSERWEEIRLRTAGLHRRMSGGNK